MNQKNSLGLNSCFLDIEDPILLFNEWMEEAKKTEPNDPNAVSLATSNKKNIPSVRMVLLKDFNENGFIFYTNLNSQKGNELKENPYAAMCFHWKSLLRQIRIVGKISLVADEVADKYYSSRAYDSRIGAWASNQSKILNSRSDLEDKIEFYKGKYPESKDFPRPDYWGGFIVKYKKIEFWEDMPHRIHKREVFELNIDNWITYTLSP